MFDKLDVYNYNCFQIQHQDSDLQMLLTSEIIYVNIVVRKVGTIRKIVFVPGNNEEFYLFVMACGGNRHGRPRM